MAFFIIYFFNYTATTECYSFCHILALPDALPISSGALIIIVSLAAMTQIAAIVTIAILPGMGIWIRATAGFTASFTAAHFLLVHAVRGILPGALAVSLNGLLLFRHHCFLTGEPAKTVRKHFATR